MASDKSLYSERHLDAAQGYLMLDMPDHALTELRAIEAPEFFHFEIAQLRGEALRQQECYGEAIQAFSKALDVDASDLTVLLGMAWCFKRTGFLYRSIEMMERAYNVHPEEPIVLYNMACYFALDGDKTQSLSWLGRALRMEPSLRKLITDETDFDKFRDDPDFQFITGENIDLTEKL
jgi:tetratricopeptide (TPR) repeat protein